MEKRYNMITITIAKNMNVVLMAQQFHGDLLSRPSLPSLLIIKRFLYYMKQVKNVFGCNILSIIFKTYVI